MAGWILPLHTFLGLQKQSTYLASPSVGDRFVFQHVLGTWQYIQG